MVNTKPEYTPVQLIPVSGNSANIENTKPRVMCTKQIFTRDYIRIFQKTINKHIISILVDRFLLKELFYTDK